MKKIGLPHIVIALGVFLACCSIVSPVAASEWVRTSGPAGGIVNSVEVHPANPDILYIAGYGGGVYKSVNGGASWSLTLKIVDEANPIQDLILSPQDPELIYALTDGLFRSQDGGTTWEQPAALGSLSSLAMLRSNPSLLVCGDTAGHVLKSPDGGETWTAITANLPAAEIADIALVSESEIFVGTATQADGRLYHTANGGTSWQEVDLPQPAHTDIQSIFVDPDDSRIIYVGLINTYNEMFDPQNDNYLLKSVDSGQHWTALHMPGADAMINIMGRAANDATLYVGTGGMLYKSDNGGSSWTSIAPSGRNGDMYDIAVDPRDASHLYLPRRAYGMAESRDGGFTWTPANEGLLNVSVSLLSMPQSAGSGTVYATANSGEGTFKTTDFGATWANISEGDITHPWADELVVSPHDPDTVWQIADVAEIFRTTDGGDSWAKIIDTYGDGFRYGSVYAVAQAPSAPETVYALKSGFGIFRSDDGGQAWSFLHQSEIDYSYTLAVHPQDKNTLYSGYNPKPFQDWAMIRQSQDGGDTWRTALQIEGAAGVTSIAIDPGQPATVYAGSTGSAGRLWVSRDNGVNWSGLHDALTFTNIHTMAVAPSAPQTAYAGVWGGGIFKTADGGATWARLAAEPTISASAILIAANDAARLYIADRTGPRIYASTDGGASFAPLFDAGAGYYRVMTAALAPSDPGLLFASVFRAGGAPMSGDLFRIKDGVASLVTGSLPRLPMALVVDPADADTVYAVLHGHGLYRSTDGGATWTDLLGAASPLQQIGFNGLAIDPSAPGRLYLFGGCDVDETFTSTGVDPAILHTVYLSTDNGATWTNLNDGHLGAASGGVKGLAIAPDNPNTLYLGTAKGVFVSRDRGGSWADITSTLAYPLLAGISIAGDGSRLYAPTLGGGVFVGARQPNDSVLWEAQSNFSATIHNVQVAVDPSTPTTIYASAYPGGIFKSTDQGATWAECNFGMASFAIDDPARQGYYAFAIAPSNTTTLYLGLYGVGVYKSTDGASTWRPMNGADQTMRGKAITSLVVDPNQANHAFVATEEGVYVTFDGGANWSAINDGLDCSDVRTLSLSPAGQLLAGTKGYELYRYDGGAGSWQQMNAFGNYGTRWPIWNDRPLYQYTSLLFHPTDPTLVYLGTFPSGIFKSTDGGASFREANVGWTNDGVFSLVFHPTDTETIYVGTYNGLNLSRDGGAHWELWDEGWPDEQWVFSIDFDWQNPAVMYACSKNGENEGLGREGFRGTVMKSTDGGASWLPITNGLDLNQEFYKIMVDRYDPQILYLASQNEGVFISSDGGGSWTAWNDGLTSLRPGTNGNNVTDTMKLTADGRQLFFGSVGSGVFRRPAATNTTPHLTVLPASYDAGPVFVNSTATEVDFSLINVGAAALSIGSVSVTGAGSDAFDIVAQNCSATQLSPLAHCTVTLRLAPTASGELNAVLAIASNDPDRPTLEVELQGTAMTAPEPDIKADNSDSPLSVVYGNAFSLSVNLQGHGSLGQTAEYWLVAETPFGFFSWVLPTGWQAGIHRVDVLPVMDLPDTLLPPPLIIPPGDYTFRFSIDLEEDGEDSEQVMDAVQVMVR